MRFDGLYRCLKGSGVVIQEYQVTTNIINVLPMDLDQVTVSLHANVPGKKVDQVLLILTNVAYVGHIYHVYAVPYVYAVGFNDKVPGGEMVANMT